MPRNRKLIAAIAAGVAAAVPLSCTTFNSWHNRGAIAAAAKQNEQELAKLGTAELWRVWFVQELQRHDLRMGLKPLPWPGPLPPLPPDPDDPGPTPTAPATRP